MFCHCSINFSIMLLSMKGKLSLSYYLLAGLRLVFNIIILVVASRSLPEFCGYRGRRFPGQQPPAPPRIAPRRLQLPPTFAQDEVSCDWWRPCAHLWLVQEWKKIGARRTKFLDLGLPKFGNPRKVYVKPHTEEPSTSHQTSLVGDVVM